MRNRPVRRGSRLVPSAGWILCALCLAAASANGLSQQPATARIAIDAGAVDGRISPMLYGQFVEFMFEGIKRGLHAELVRNRGFEEPASAIGLSQYWERYPDDRNDDYGMSFRWDEDTAYRTMDRGGPVSGHSLRVELPIHHYYSHRDMGGDLRNLLARPLHYERFYDEIEAELGGLAPDRRPTLAINEWGLDLPESLQYSIVAALYAARLMNVFERQGDLIAMSAVSDLVNGWPGGIIQASSHGLFVTPTYLVNSLYATHLGLDRLATTVDGPAFSTSREGSDVPAVDVTASRSADGRRIFVKAVNTDLDGPITARVSVRGGRVSPSALVKRVVARSVAAVNGFAAPEAVRVTEESIKAGNTFALELPRHSVAVVTLTLRP